MKILDGDDGRSLKGQTQENPDIKKERRNYDSIIGKIRLVSGIVIME